MLLVVCFSAKPTKDGARPASEHCPTTTTNDGQSTAISDATRTNASRTSTHGYEHAYAEHAKPHDDAAIPGSTSTNNATRYTSCFEIIPILGMMQGQPGMMQMQNPQMMNQNPRMQGQFYMNQQGMMQGQPQGGKRVKIQVDKLGDVESDWTSSSI